MVKAMDNEVATVSARVPATVEYGDYSIDSSRLPAVAFSALMRRGLAHLLGNEQAAKLVAWDARAQEAAKASWIAANPSGDASAQDFAPTTEARAAEKLRLQASAIAALYDGSIGVRAPRAEPVDPLDAEVWKLAKVDTTYMLTSLGLKFPRGNDKDGNPNTVTLNGQVFTADEIVEKFLSGTDKKGRYGKPGESHRARITRQAEKNIRERSKKSAKVADATAEDFI